MADNQNLIVEVLIKYALEQPLSEAEQQLLDEWRSRSAEHRELPDQLRDPQWREQHRREISDAPSEEMWANISRYISGQQEGQRTGVTAFHKRRGLIAAAAILLFVGAGIIAARWSNSRNGAGQVKEGTPLISAIDRTDDSSNLLLVSAGHLINLDKYQPEDVIWTEGTLRIEKTLDGIAYRSAGAGKGRWQVLSVGPRARKPLRVDLPGGHRVWLNNASQLAYASRLKDGADPVLNGEAFFEIAADAGFRPLEIKTKKGETMRVLGTAFGIRSFNREQETRVELYSGKVQVKSHSDSVVLRPDFAAILQDGNGPKLVRLDNPKMMPHWLELRTSPYFEFENTPFPVALHEIACWYSMNLSNPNRVKGIPITGRLPRNESLDHTLRSFEQVEQGGVILQRSAGTIIVKPR